MAVFKYDTEISDSVSASHFKEIKAAIEAEGGTVMVCSGKSLVEIPDDKHVKRGAYVYLDTTGLVLHMDGYPTRVSRGNLYKRFTSITPEAKTALERDSDNQLFDGNRVSFDSSTQVTEEDGKTTYLLYYGDKLQEEGGVLSVYSSNTAGMVRFGGTHGNAAANAVREAGGVVERDALYIPEAKHLVDGEKVYLASGARLDTSMNHITQDISSARLVAEFDGVPGDLAAAGCLVKGGLVVFPAGATRNDAGEYTLYQCGDARYAALRGSLMRVKYGKVNHQSSQLHGKSAMIVGECSSRCCWGIQVEDAFYWKIKHLVQVGLVAGDRVVYRGPCQLPEVLRGAEGLVYSSTDDHLTVQYTAGFMVQYCVIGPRDQFSRADGE